MNYLHNEDESKDAVLEVFEKVGTDLRRYEVRDFGSWLHTVTRNHCFHQLRKKRANLGFKEENPEYSQHIAEYEGEKSDSEETEQFFLHHLNEALKTLSEEQRLCVEMFYLQEKSYEEIEKATGYSYNKVKSFIQNGKRNLKIYLSRKKNDQ
jgi:RNA polymerase sigma-70 factor (ECF subfamily)